jgi:L-asparaginase/Glu-tRNA(Gln) amidotransferase subunit D
LHLHLQAGHGTERKGWLLLLLLLPAVNGTVTISDIPSRASTMATQHPESRVLIIMTGGTICMKSSPEGLVPARGFLEQGMAPRPSFNDGSQPGM